LWDRQKIAMTGEAASRALLAGDPRIVMDPARGQGQPAPTGVSVTPYMMAAGDERIIADKLHALLSKPPAQTETAAPAAATGDLTGQWNVRIQYAAVTSNHVLHLTQKGNDLAGLHQGEFVTREVAGTMDGDTVRIRSAYGEQHGDSVNMTFSGKVAGDQISGALDMGEYLSATWTATRRTEGRRG
jgi:L-seryl-tRNA(Ser) seleniumtransferase